MLQSVVASGVGGVAWARARIASMAGRQGYNHCVRVDMKGGEVSFAGYTHGGLGIVYTFVWD